MTRARRRESRADRFRRWAETERFWIISGIVPAFAWFLFNFSLPPYFKGRICCDSTDYIKASGHLNSFADLFRYIQLGEFNAHKVPAYPLFLSLHRHLIHLLGLGTAIDWVAVSLFTALALYFISCIYFYRSLPAVGARIHPFALFLLLVEPGLVSHAALPLTDTFSTCLIMLGVGSSLRAGMRFTRMGLRRAVFAGVMFGLAILSRPSLQPAIAAFILYWLCVASLRGRRAKLAALLPALTGLACLLATAPQYIACTDHFGEFCFQGRAFMNDSKYHVLSWGLGGARAYSLIDSKINSTGLVKVPDPFMMENYGSCAIDYNTPEKSYVRCLLARPFAIPVFALKKSIGLFDNFHLNTYAVNITQDWQRYVNRVFGVMGFMGFVLVLALLAWGAFAGKAADPWFLALVFPVIHIAFSTAPHVESRYGFQALPFCLLALVFASQTILNDRGRRKYLLLSVIALSGIVFLAQVHAWDRLDPMRVENIKDLPPGQIDYSMGD